MSKKRCDKCGALLKAGDIKKEKCWKCGEVVIQKVEQETQPDEDITSGAVAQKDGKEKQTDENKTPDPIMTQSNTQSKAITTFLKISAAFFVINTIYGIIFGSGLGFYSFSDFSIILVILQKINPLTIPLHLLNEFFGSQWLWIFNSPARVFYDWGYYGVLDLFVPVLLWIGGPVLSFFVGKKLIGRLAIEAEPIKAEPIPTVLKTSGFINNSFSLGLNNKGLIIGASILWALTAWIPYLNVGTTIGFLGIIVSISKGDSVFATEIFNAKYRKNMGEFFLLLSFMIIGIFTGYAFVIIPGIVISIAWSQSILLFIDKGYSPLESIKNSNDITYGEKWTIFIGYLSLVLILGLFIGLCTAIVAVNESELLALIIGFIGFIAFTLVMVGCSAYIYGELNKKLTAENN